MDGIYAGLSHLRGRESSRVLDSRELGEMPNRFLCPKCHGQRTTSCASVCKECKGSGNRRCDVYGGTGEIEAADRT
jgi:DnaJ-class molecular chaperone